MGLFRESESDRVRRYERQNAELAAFRANAPYAHKVLGAEGDWTWNPIDALERVCKALYELERRVAHLEED